MTLLGGCRVVDVTSGIAGAYCTKLLADAGAVVVKVEGPGGDPLRRWNASAVDLGDEDGALFQFLGAGKSSLVGDIDASDVRRFLSGADLVVEDGSVSDVELERLRVDYPALSVVSITPFGRTGPWRHRPATEFVLQALCGSVAGRGTLDRPPVHAGGRLGEWISGTFAAVAALAVLRGARRRGAGDRVDLAMMEAMAIFMAGAAGLAASLAGASPSTAPPRTVEMPSIEPTSDGYIGFCTVTAQQFRDFLVMIDRADLLEDTQLVTFAGRNARREEFQSVMWDWTTKRTSSDIEELASLMRIPVSPIGTPDSITAMEHFVRRGVFGRAPGGFAVPRRPYRVDDETVPVDPPSSPALGACTVEHWPARPAPSPAPGSGAGRGADLPLAGLRIVDLTAFWAGPAATFVLGALGAEVVKVESVTRPDPMRFASVKAPGGPQWWEWGSVFHGNNFNKLGITLDLRSSTGRDLLLGLIAEADAVIENFSPRVLDNFGITWDTVRSINDRVVMVRMPAFGLSGPWRDRTGFAQTMEQASGMAWMTGFNDGPPIIPRGPCDPLAGLHAAFALLACIEERDRGGTGHHVESTMVEAALNAAAEVVIERSAYGARLIRDGNRGPVSAPQGLYACRSDDGREQWLALAVPDDQAWSGLCAAMGTPAWPDGVDTSGPAARRAAHDEIDAVIATWCAERLVDDVVADLIARGVPAGRVTEAREFADLDQVRARGFAEEFDHPVVGRHRSYGMPFRLASYDGPWLRTPSPTLGQHNTEVLTGILGLDAAELAHLEADGVIGDTLRQ